MYYSGERNVGGAAGNLLGTANTGGIPNLPVDSDLLKKLKQPGTSPPPGFREQYGLPSGPDQKSPNNTQFRQALGGFTPVGNLGGLLAQAYPGASALGGQMGMNMGMPQGIPGMPTPNVFSVRPRVSYRESEEGGLDLGGSVNIPIGKEGRINVQGGYQPETNIMNLQGTIGQPPGTQGLGLDFFVNRNLNRKFPGGMDDMGGQLRYNTQF
jgi:hypothetical protein